MRIESVQKGASGIARVAAGGSLFVLSPVQLELLGLPESALSPGTELDESAIALLELAASAHEAEKKALALVARAEQSRAMLGAKLKLRGFGDKAVSLALESLAGQGLVDDLRFARAWAASRMAQRPEGPASLRAALMAKGLDRDIVDRAIFSIFNNEDKSRLLRRSLEKLSRRHADDRGLLRSKLRRLGYSYTEIDAQLENSPKH